MGFGIKRQLVNSLELDRQSELQKNADARKQQEAALGRPLTDIEVRSGIVSPDYKGPTDASGNLKDNYKFDPTKSEAFQALKAQAMGPGPSIWANMQTQQQQAEQQNLVDQSNQQNMQAQGLARANLMRSGGLSGGAANRMAMQGARDQMMANQGIARQGMADRLGISQGDQDRKNELMGQIAQTELGGQNTNLGTYMTDLQNKGVFDINKYKEQMASWGADKSAAAQRAAAGGGGKK